MDNTCRTAMAAAVAGGYVLGRTKKAKVALGLAMFVAGRRLKLAPADLAAAGVRQLAGNPQLAGLREQMREDLYGAVKTAAAAVVDRQVSSLTDSLRERSEKMASQREQGGSSEDEEEPEEGEEPRQDAGNEEDGEPEEDEEPEQHEALRRKPKKHAHPPAKKAAKKTAARTPAKAGR